MKYLFILIFIFLLGINHSFAEPTALVLKPHVDTVVVTDHMEIFRDESNKLTLKDVLSPEIEKKFKPFDYLDFTKYLDLTTWLRFKIYNPDKEPREFFLSYDVNPDTGWTLYQQTSPGKFEMIPLHPRGKHLGLYFLKIPPEKTYTYYLQRYSEGRNQATRFIAEKPHPFVLRVIDRYGMFGLLIGVILALFLHSLFVYLFTKDPSYLAYMGFVLGSLSYFVWDNGLLLRIPNVTITNWQYSHILQIIIVMLGFFYVLFAKIVLRAHVYTPFINKIMKIYLLLPLVFVIYAIFDYAVDIFVYYMLFGIILSFVVAVFIAFFKKYSPAKYYLAGIVWMIFTYFIAYMERQGLFHRNFFSENSLGLGISIGLILSAIALAARYNWIKQEEEKASLALIKQKELTAEVQAQAIKEQKVLIYSYERFFPHRFLDILDKKSITEIQLGDQVEKNMTVLFSDIRNFTSILEGKTPQESFQFINDYLGEVGPLIRKHQGFVDKYIGDTVMAVFEKSPEDALHAAIKTIIKASSFREIKIGMGIHCGPVMIGTVGEKLRMDGTVISDVVNLASRLESLNKMYATSIIVSKDVLDNLQNKEYFYIRFLDHIYAKGKEKEVKIYEIYNPDSPELVEKKKTLNDDYHGAIQYYQQQEFSKALKIFEHCSEIIPEDEVYKIYIARCQKYLGRGYDPNWSPIIRLGKYGGEED